MTYPPQAGFGSRMVKNSVLWAGTWAAANFRGGVAIATKNVELGVFWCLFFVVVVGDSLRGQGLAREEWGFPDQAGVSWRSREHI